MSAAALAPARPPPAAPAPAESDFDYDSILEGLQGGRFGGRPLDGPGPRALVGALRRLAWPVDARALAAAVPHFPERFELPEIRATLHNLGYSTERARLSGRRLAREPGAVLVLGRRGRIRIVAGGAEPGLVDPGGGPARGIRPRSRYDCLVVEDGGARPVASAQGVPAAMAARFRPELRLVLALTVLSGLNLVAASLSIGLVFATVLPARALDTLAMLIVGIAGLLAFDLALRRIRARVIARVSARLEYILATEVHAKLIGLPIERITGASVADQLGRLRQFETVRDLFAGPVASVLLELPLVALMLVVMAAIDGPSAAVAAAGIGVQALVGVFAVPRIKAAQATLAEGQSQHARLLEEVLSQREQILRRGLGPRMEARLAPHHRRVAAARLRAEMARRRLAAALHVLTPLTGAGVLGVGALQVMAGAMPAAALIVCMILTVRLLAPVHQGLLLAVRLPELAGLLRQLDALLRLPDGDRGPPRTAASPRVRATAGAGRLRLEGVVFRYPRAHAPALRGVSLEVPPGRLVAVAGASGAGKSTLLRAVMGAHALQAGRVALGPFNLAQVGSQRRTELIGHLGHHPLLIHGTVAQNLTLGVPEASPDAMREVCDEIGLLSAVEAMPGEFDARLAGGTAPAITPAFRTKLAIARLLLRQPSILLLDEPEARLSPADEARLMTALRRRTARGATCLMVTHRPSLMRAADRVLRLEAGRVVSLDPPAPPPADEPDRRPA